MFGQEFSWTLLALFALGINGYCLIAPFRNPIKYWLYATPLAGMLGVTLITSTAYTLLKLPLAVAVVSACIPLMLLSAVTFYFIRPTINKEIYSILAMSVAITALLTYLSNYTSIQFGHRGFLFVDGSDHLGYVQVADWLRTHLVTAAPVANPAYPAQSWTEAAYYSHTIDAQRFGSYFILAIVALLHGTSPLFVYDLLCGIILITGYLAVTALYSRTPWSFLLLFLGLFSCIWFDYSRSGYLGKILSYPTLLLLIGIFFSLARQQLTMTRVTALAFLTCAAAIMYPATAIAVNLGILASLFLLSRLLIRVVVTHQESITTIADEVLLLILLTGIAIATTGALAIPSWMDAGILDAPWHTVIPYLFGIIPATSLNYSLSPHLFNLSYIYIFSTFILLGIALYHRNERAIALLATPLLILLILFIDAMLATKSPVPDALNKVRWISYQYAGYFCPLTFIGAIWLLDTLQFDHATIKKWGLKILILLLFFAALSIHFTRLAIVLPRYAGKNIDKTLQFSQPELNQLAHSIIGQNVVVENLNGANHTLPLLIYVSPYTPHMQWSPAAWQAILAYRHWQTPKTDPNTRLFIFLNNYPIPSGCILRFKTRQYQLLDCHSPVKNYP